MTRIAPAASIAALAVAAALGAAAPAQAQSTASPQAAPQDSEAIRAILGALFGDRLGVSTSLESEWNRGRRPLANQRTQFESRIDADVRSGRLNRWQGERLRSDYQDLVDLEARYTADGRVTTQERADLTERYRAFSQRLENGGSDGGWNDGGGWNGGNTGEVASGRTEFEARVDAQVRNRRLTRTQGTQLKNDYQSLITVEQGYLRDGRLSASERADLDSRLDALDSRVGDFQGGGGGAVQTPRARLDAIARAVTSSGLNASAQAQLRVEHEDLSRLEAAYARLSPTQDERSYLERRLADLETRVRIRR